VEIKQLKQIYFLIGFGSALVTLMGGALVGQHLERLNAHVTQIQKVEHWKTRYDICAKQFLGDIADMKEIWSKK